MMQSYSGKNFQSRRHTSVYMHVGGGGGIERTSQNIKFITPNPHIVSLYLYLSIVEAIASADSTRK